MSARPSALSRAWRWSIDESPLLALAAWIVRRDRSVRAAHAALNAAELPGPIDARIRETVRRLRLWSGERVEIANEFIEHAHDALEKGHTPHEITDRFGNPRVVARLLTRAAKRKRPFAWRIYRDARRAAGAALIVLIASYAVLVVRFHTGSPSVEQNYLAQFNERRDSFPDSDHAWPVYQEVHTAWRLESVGVEREQKARADSRREQDGPFIDAKSDRYRAGLRLGLDITPEHPDYEETIAMHRAFRPELDRVIDAASKACVGVLYSDRSEDVHAGEGVMVHRVIPPSGDPREQGALIEVLLPHLGVMRSLSNKLIFDARIAASEGDADRVVAAHGALTRMAHQLSGEPNFLISDLVAMAILMRSVDRLSSTIELYPNLFTPDHLQTLAHDHAAARSVIKFSTDAESMMFRDLLQRAFTDDGHGNGRITSEGLELFELYGVLGDYGLDHVAETWPHGFVDMVSPLSMVLFADRRAQLARYQEIMDSIDRVLIDGPETIGRLSDLERQAVERKQGAAVSRYLPVDVMTPAYTGVVERVYQHRMSLEAGLLMLALETHRTEHGAYPQTLEALGSRLLPRVPADRFDPGNAIRYISHGHGFVLYSVGADGKDDGGVAPTENAYKVKRFESRFPPRYIKEPGAPMRLETDARGFPVPGEPEGPEGDWVLIEIDRAGG